MLLLLFFVLLFVVAVVIAVVIAAVVAVVVAVAAVDPALDPTTCFISLPTTASIFLFWLFSSMALYGQFGQLFSSGNWPLTIILLQITVKTATTEKL